MQGRFLPLDIFPPQLTEFLKYTPFPYSYFYTIKIFIDSNIIITYEYYIIQLSWIIFLTGICYNMWKYGTKKYEAIGI